MKNRHVLILRRDALAIQSLLDCLNANIEALVDCHSVAGELDARERFRLRRDIRMRCRSERLLIALDEALDTGIQPTPAARKAGA